MPNTKQDSRQWIHKLALNRLSKAVDPEGDNIIASIDSELTPPLEMQASSTPDLVLNLGAIMLQNSETDRFRTIPPISNLLPTFAGGTVTFPATSGNPIVTSAGDDPTLTISNDSFLKMGVFLDPLGNIVLQPGTEGASLAAATNPPLVSSTHPMGYVVVRTVGAAVQNVEDSDIYQYVGGGAGGSGSGDASSIITRLKDTQENSIFKQMTGVDLSSDEDAHIDGSSTGSFSLVSGTFEFSAAAETLVTTDNLLSTPEFITPAKTLGKLQLVVFWAEGSVDTAATYEVKTTTGSFEAVTMERVGNASDAYHGTLDISSYTSPDNLQLRITSSAGSTAVAGYGLFYEVEGQLQLGEKLVKDFTFQSNSAPASFTLDWTPDPELLTAHLRETSQTLVAATSGDSNGFVVTGNTVTFPG